MLSSTPRILALATVLWTLPAAFRPEIGAAATRPNVVIIFTDDQGSIDAGCYGADDLETPGIDRLAARGVRFTQFYAASAVCSPSRAGLLTGRHPVRAGVPSNATSRQGEAAGLPSEEITIAETMKAAGYATAHIGKWHLGYVPEKMPNAQGFDFSFGHMGGCIDNYSHFFYWNGPNRHDLWRNGREVHRAGHFFPDLMVEQAAEFIEAHREQPFFMYFAMNTPHYPYQGDAAWLERYADLPYPRNLYNAFVSTLDARIARLLDVLDQLQIAENTIVVFQSDHGHSVEDRAHRGGGNNGPYRGNKFTLFEGGIRVPAMIAWTGHLPAGEVRDQMAHSCDWLPTIADLCQVPLLDRAIDGQSIAEVIRSDVASPHETLHWQIGVGGKAQWAVRRGDWKLIGNANPPADGPELTGEDRKLFLSNLDQDVSEAKNLIGDHREIAAELQTLHTQWEQSLDRP
ncbi:MAG: sulfatase-like hydrolase/transferase [Planctomycetales bacterium]|nr:sulfatase-like hydrolase/transferase [Planctomycetales bacterium]